MSILGLMIGTAVGAAVLLLVIRFFLRRGPNSEVSAAAKPKPDKHGFNWDNFETEYTEADRMVRYADRPWPYVLGDKRGRETITIQALFIVNLLTSAFLVAMSGFGAYAVANGAIALFVLLASISVLFQGAQWFLTIRSDQPQPWMVAVVILIGVVNAGYSLVGAAAFGNSVDTRANISAGAVTTELTERATLTDQLAKLRIKRAEAGSLPIATLEAQEKAARDREFCESWLGGGRRVCPQEKVQAREYGGKCGPVCQGHKAEADKLAAMLADARSEKALSERLAGLNKGLESRDVARTNSSAFEVQGTKIGYDIVQILLVLFVTGLDLALCIVVGNETRARHRVYLRSAKERANRLLEDAGLPPRYVLDEDPAPMPSEAKAKAAGGDQITIVAKVDADALIDASEDLSEIKTFWLDTVRPADPKAVLTFGRLFDVYKARAEAQDRREWTGRHDFMTHLRRYLELKEITHSGARITGWKFGVTAVPSSDDDTTKEETAA